MKKLTALFAVAMSMVVLGGCVTTTKGHGEVTAEAKLQQAKTYAFISEKPLLRSDPDFPQLKVGQIEDELRVAISRELEAKGFVPGDTTLADVVVAFAVSAKERADIYDVYLTHRFASPARAIYVDAHEYVEGALIIDLFSGDDGSQLWHGWAKKRFNRLPDEGSRRQYIDEAVKAIIDTLPAR